MNLTLHLTFPGNCEQAFRFYAECLRGNLVTLLTWGESPAGEQVPANWHPKILHATLKAGDLVLAGIDILPAEFQRPQGFSALLEVDQPAEAERLFAALSTGGTVTMPLQPTFWAERFGVFTDQFGISWEINCGTSTGP